MSGVWIYGEGPPDIEAVERLCKFVGGIEVIGKKALGGKTRVDPRLDKWNESAKFNIPFVVFRDLDNDYVCAPELVADKLPDLAPLMLFRIAVRSLESWLLADRNGLAKFLQVSRARLPLVPDDEHHPKTTLINIARRSRSSRIRERIVPHTPLANQGPEFSAALTEFIWEGWDPDRARQNSPSLDKTIAAFERFSQRLNSP